MIKLGIFQECLGRNASPIEAGAASPVSFDAGDFFSELGGANSSDVTGRSATNNNQIVGHDRSALGSSGRSLRVMNEVVKGEGRTWSIHAKSLVSPESCLIRLFMLKEFKDFAFKGNVVDMAVGIIIGGAFATVVKSLVNNVFMPPLGQIVAGKDFTKLKWVLEPGVTEVKEGDKILIPAKPEVAISYGQFIADSISFLLLALVVFIVVKKLMVAFEKKKEEEPAKPPEPSSEEKLLTEIRDLLKEKA